MTRAQWKAVYAYCKEYDCTAHDLLIELRANGTLGRNEGWDELSNCVDKKDYDSMLKFLEENL